MGCSHQSPHLTRRLQLTSRTPSQVSIPVPPSKHQAAIPCVSNREVPLARSLGRRQSVRLVALAIALSLASSASHRARMLDWLITEQAVPQVTKLLLHGRGWSNKFH